jgi:hypothetical protein
VVGRTRQNCSSCDSSPWSVRSYVATSRLPDRPAARPLAVIAVAALPSALTTQHSTTHRQNTSHGHTKACPAPPWVTGSYEPSSKCRPGTAHTLATAWLEGTARPQWTLQLSHYSGRDSTAEGTARPQWTLQLSCCSGRDSTVEGTARPQWTCDPYTRLLQGPPCGRLQGLKPYLPLDPTCGRSLLLELRHAQTDRQQRPSSRPHM